jgi:putative SOS response-associated peptidase YedK
MCGRFGQKSLEAIEEEYHFDDSSVKDFESNYNTDIGNNALIVSNDNPNKLVYGMFGYTPIWESKLKYIFNARCEGDFNADNTPSYHGQMGVFEKPYFRKVITEKRCVVPVDYFVEGPQKEKLQKPFIIKRKDDKPYLLGGVWENWVDKSTGEVIRTFAILTTPQTPLLAKVGHHRSPLVIPDNKLQWWLNTSTSKEDLQSIMKPFDDRDFLAYPVSSALRSKNIHGSNNSSALIEPIGESISV